MHPPQRILVVGTSGSGKTTTARRISQRLDLPHVELDAIHWQPDWRELALAEFRSRVSEAVAKDAWVVDGNYSKVRDLVLARAEAIVYLDLPLWLCVARLLGRSVRRALTREPLWAGNRESLFTTFFTSDSVIYYAIRTQRRRQAQYAAIHADPAFQHIRFIHLRSQRAVDAWIEGL
jgi:adenylate kinase family enzyme